MVFRFFEPLFGIITDINQSSDIIQSRRFRQQVRDYQLKRALTDRNGPAKDESSEINLHPDGPRPTSRLERRGIWQDIKHMIELNQNTYFQFFLYLFYVIFISLQAIRCFLYGVLPRERDPVTLLRQDRVLRFLESIYLIDLMKNFKEPALFNRVFAIFCIQFAILRIRHLIRRLVNARSNRDEYKKINIVQLHMSTANNFYYSFGDLIWILNCYKHQCDLESPQALKRHSLMRNFVKRLRSVGNLERFYYYNQIDFEHCYEGRIFVRGRQSADEGGKTSASWLKRLLFRFFKLFALSQSGRSNFYQKPTNRMDPLHLMLLSVVYVCALFCTVFLLFVGIACSIVPDLVGSGLDFSNIRGTWWVALVQYTSRKELHVFAFETSIVQVMLALFALDNGLLVVGTLTCLSRTDRVVKLIKRELRWYRHKLRRLGVKLQLSDNLESPCPKESSSQANHNRRWPVYASLFQDEESDDGLEADFEKNVSEFRKSLAPAEVKEFNINMDYIVDLICVLEREFSDLQQLLTLNLNLNIIFGTCCTSIIFLALSRLEGSEFLDYIMWMILLAIIIMPLLISLFLAATTEGSVSVSFVAV